MEIIFGDRKLGKAIDDPRRLDRERGARQAALINRRIAALHAANNLGDFWPPYSGPERCHELIGNRQGQLSMDLDGPFRLLFKPAQVPTPQRPEGGLDWQRVTAVIILGVENTHD